jgi:hypothetical protein
MLIDGKIDHDKLLLYSASSFRHLVNAESQGQSPQKSRILFGGNNYLHRKSIVGLLTNAMELPVRIHHRHVVELDKSHTNISR